MTQKPEKRIPLWLTIDVLIIIVGLAIIAERTHFRDASLEARRRSISLASDRLT
jgi:hypothetical protein